MNNIYERLKELHITLPPSPGAVGLYTPALLTGDYIYLSGNGGPDLRNLPVYGKIGKDVTIEQGRLCARGAVLALLSAAESVAGSLERIERIVKLVGFINSADDFYEQPRVVDGASELLIDIFGKEKGIHARSAVGVASLPLNIPVEIEMIIEIKKSV